ncbi:hydroxysqualene dehydroxylase HpnE [Lacisediminimonas sp.]|uniref:hydroxysqualene dehydroxylase HpnE n=1 Tax=Lacisediminimonas sp. TaxID=3060582 RepID=UPI002722ADD8|nr:hydroxysqualene dehydroxylase HpnE [Lacisediminimonas sp.]MDO8299490.1 hydroxysqualene dehydroxylase HpnE [Lacisediminimonas sp.]
MAASPVRRVGVIGGGWAGCSAACELARLGDHVVLLEAARELGGRARRIEVNGRILDNGQHILLGAYAETLRLMALVGIAPANSLLRLPLQMHYPPGSGGMQLRAAPLPAPLHLLLALLRAGGLERDDKLAIARFQSTARWSGWTLYDDCSVSALLERYDQTPAVIRQLWRPLCIAALNTPPERASAQVFLNVLKDSLGSRRSASDMLLPKVDLGMLFPDRAADYVRRNQGKVQLGARVQGIIRGADGWTVEVAGQASECFDAIVMAAPPWQAKALLEPSVPGLVPEFSYEPIQTCYLQYSPTLSLPQPFFALLDDPAAGDYGQFVFDRGQLDPMAAGLLAVVTSAWREPEDQKGSDAPAAQASTIAGQLARAFGDPRLLHPQWSKVITEKRATFSCTPALQRPPNDTGEPGLWLAGDYTAGDYPATIESAVRSGLAAARGLHQSSSRT